MFSYYGSKSKIAKLYPAPRYDRIIEPFAGSARYALLYPEREVNLFDLSPYVVEVWRYLIQATKSDILALPDVPSKVHISTYEGLTETERWLIGFHFCRGKAVPRKTGHGQNSWNRDKRRIADLVGLVKHWTIEQKSYSEVPNLEGTHFVDPPYEAVQIRSGNSDRYPHWFVDYPDLAVWCRSRDGQVIVCEGGEATWLPFRPLTKALTNTNNKNTRIAIEQIWTNE